MKFLTDKNFAIEMDNNDPLASYRDKFYIPLDPNGNEIIYFLGNSLGLQPKGVKVDVEEVLTSWKNLGVEGHFKGNNPWMEMQGNISKRTAKIVGAKPVEVVTMNALTVNLHLMMVSFYRPTPSRHKILIEKKTFPSDQYAIQSQIKFHGYDPESSIIEINPRYNESTLHMEDIKYIIDQEGEEIALILLGGINYYSGQVFNMKNITDMGHAKGCVVGFDLAHAVGNVILKLHDWDVDFAVWCTYKYLNGGPGSLGGCFINEKHHKNSQLPRFSGWWGQNLNTRFLMPSEFDPIPSAEGWQISNPSILSLSALSASLEIFKEIGMPKLWEKSILLTGYLEYLINELLGDKVTILTPKNTDERGCQLSLVLKEKGKEIYENLVEKGVMCDWREPDVIRVAPVPLYNSFQEIYDFCHILLNAIKDI
jgi:kynureninase